MYLIELLASLLAVAVVLTLHEFSHAFVAYRCGDPTPKWAGRLTLNPLKHFDPLGLVLFALAGFGWAKPVPINPSNFRKQQKGAILTSIAGVGMNFLFALLFYPVYVLVLRWIVGVENLTMGHIFLQALCVYLFVYSLNFCAFNLLPLYPLDGFRLIEAANKKRGRVYCFLRDYGHYILLGLIALSYLSRYMAFLNPLGFVMGRITSILMKPITFIWGFVL